MASRPHRIGIVGAASLVGRELSDALPESPLAACDVVLLDAEDAAGQITTAGDEPSIIQKIDTESFVGIDFVFFAGDAESTRKYWKSARQEGASIVDLSYALEAEPGVVVRGPWASLPVAVRGDGLKNPRAQDPDLTTPAVVSAHPAALALLLIGERLRMKLPVRNLSATVFEPASQHSQAAMDELHQQTVSLLSFQALPRQQYDAQVAFNLLPSLGDAAVVKLEASRERIMDHYQTLRSAAAPELALQLIQAPVFHGYTASMLVELEEPASIAQVEAALEGAHIDLVGSESDPPSNLSAVAQPDILVRISAAMEGDRLSGRFWLWLAADNLKVAVLNAIACANELRSLRPLGTVQ